MSETNPAAPTIAPMRPDQLTPGESYDSWICAVCQNVVALAPRAPRGDPFDLPDGLVKVVCPSCRKPSARAW